MPPAKSKAKPQPQPDSFEGRSHLFQGHDEATLIVFWATEHVHLQGGELSTDAILAVARKRADEAGVDILSLLVAEGVNALAADYLDRLEREQALYAFLRPVHDRLAAEAHGLAAATD